MLKGALLALFAAVLFATPVFAVTAQEKQKTCAIGADSQKLTGKRRSDFIRKCMADEDGAPKSGKPAKPQPPQ